MFRQGSDAALDIDGPRPLPAVAAERILRELPQWFGIEVALLDYAREAEALPNFVATRAGTPVGFVTLRAHNSSSLELSCIAVSPGHHRAGVGSALCDAAEGWWSQRGGEMIQVKTLGPSHPDPNYARTRAFYRARGFVPVEEFEGLWPGIPCLLMVKALAVGKAAPTS